MHGTWKVQELKLLEGPLHVKLALNNFFGAVPKERSGGTFFEDFKILRSTSLAFETVPLESTAYGQELELFSTACTVTYLKVITWLGTRNRLQVEHVPWRRYLSTNHSTPAVFRRPARVSRACCSHYSREKYWCRDGWKASLSAQKLPPARTKFRPLLGCNVSITLPTKYSWTSMSDHLS